MTDCSALPSFTDIEKANKRLNGIVKNTPIFTSSVLNNWMGQEIYFKAECLQHTGSFKFRGASNYIAKAHEQGNLPKHILANSSGNHAQAIACASDKFGIPATIFAGQTISTVKAAATRGYGAELKLFPTRLLADEAVKAAAEQEGAVWIPPFNHPDIVAGQGTAAYEALKELGNVDAVFAPCGGGGLLSGTLLASRGLCPNALVIGSEPAEANDASMSLQKGEIVALETPPQTLADGAATPAVGKITFEFLQQLDDFYEVSEQQIAYWTQWLQHLLKLHIEPTSAMSMAAVAAWAVNTTPGKKALVILSGGNISQQTTSDVWTTDYLQQPPIIEYE